MSQKFARLRLEIKPDKVVAIGQRKSARGSISNRRQVTKSVRGTGRSGMKTAIEAAISELYADVSEVNQ